MGFFKDIIDGRRASRQARNEQLMKTLPESHAQKITLTLEKSIPSRINNAPTHSSPLLVGMNYDVFCVRGINTASRRKKRIIIERHKNQSIEDLALKEGLEPPYEISIQAHEMPTERQLEYARSLKIKIPAGATMVDVSCLISRAVDSDSEPNPGLIEYADNKGFLFSYCIGKKQLYNLIFRQLEGLDMIAFFCFSIYRYLSDDRHANLDTSPHRQAMYEFAAIYVNDKKFITSMNKYEGSELRFFGRLQVKTKDNCITEYTGGSTATFSYKTCAEFLHKNYNTPLTKTKTLIK